MNIFILCVFVAVFIRETQTAGGYSKGTQFVVSFLYNFGLKDATKTANYLFISSDVKGEVTAEMNQVSNTSPWSQNYTLSPMSTIMIALPDQSEMSNVMGVEPKGIFITSDVDISVYAMNDDTDITSADAAVVLPVQALSKNYIVPTAEINPVIAVAAVVPNTIVTVNLQTSCTIDYHGGKYTRNANITETLKLFDVFQIQSTFASANDCDFGGTTITSSQPVAVFSGSSCYFSRTTGCDHYMQQVRPNELLGMRFIIPDLADKSDYRVRLLAITDSTTVIVNEHHKDGTIHSYQMQMDKGSLSDRSIPDGTDLEIFANRGLSVTQFDGSPAPFSMPIPAVENYGWNYTISTMNNPTSATFINYVNLVIHRDSVHSTTIDGSRIDVSKWRRIRDLGYSAATVPVSSGSHRIVADDKFMVQVYGYDGSTSYGYQAGYFLSVLPSEHLVVSTPGPTSGTVTTTHAPITACSDSKGVDCQALDSILGICQTPDSPTHICRKHCGYCGTGNPVVG